MEFDVTTQSFYYPGINIRYYKKDLVREIDEYADKCNTLEEFEGWRTSMTELKRHYPTSILFPSDLLQSILNVSDVDVYGYADSLLRDYFDFPKVKGYEEIWLNYVFLLCEKHYDKVMAVFEIPCERMISRFTDVYVVNDDTLEKFQFYFVKLVMLGFPITQKDKFHFVVMLFKTLDPLKWLGKDLEKCVFSYAVLCYIILLVFQNGYEPYIELSNESSYRSSYFSCEREIQNDDCVCTGCTSLKIVFKVYNSYLRSVTLFDLMKTRLQINMPIRVFDSAYII
jgi:hypothetical protein